MVLEVLQLPAQSRLVAFKRRAGGARRRQLQLVPLLRRRLYRIPVSCQGPGAMLPLKWCPRYGTQVIPRSQKTPSTCTLSRTAPKGPGTLEDWRFCYRQSTSGYSQRARVIRWVQKVLPHPWRGHPCLQDTSVQLVLLLRRVPSVSE